MKLPNINVEGINSLEEAKNIIEQLILIIRHQQEQIDRLTEEINRLKGQPKRPSFSGPPSHSSSVSKFLKEKTLWNKTSKKGKVPVDREVQLPEVETCKCGCTTFTTLRTTTRIVQGLVLKRDNVSYYGTVKKCRDCGKQYRCVLPTELRNQSFSPELSSLLSFFVYSCRMTQPLILRMLDGMGLSISSGQVSNLLLKNGEKLQRADRHLRTTGIAKSPHLQSDASGAKRKDKRTGRIINHYVQVISHRLLSIFSITPKYNAKTLNKLLTKTGRQKLFVSDDGSPNGDRLQTKRQLCWVHEIRHYKKMFPFFNPHRKLQEKILHEWRVFYQLAKHYKETRLEEREERRKQIQQLFHQITNQSTGFEVLDRQLQLTRKKEGRLLLFLDHPDLPIHNNQCEQDLRHFVIMRKITGGTKSAKGDRSLARHLSVIQTAQKQGLDVFQTLHGLLIGTLSPSVLTAQTY